MVDDRVESSTQNETLKNKIDSFEEEWLGEFEAKVLERFKDEKKQTDFWQKWRTETN